MTERLATLLREEALDLPVPPAPAASILRDGRAQRRRRSAATVVGSLAVAAVVGGTSLLGAGVLGGEDPGPTVLDPASAPVPTWVVGSGQDVLLGNGERVEVDGTVKSVYYTSAGILVRKGATATTDAPDSAYSLVTEDGTTSSFALSLGDRVPSTDPTLPYLAYASASDGPTDWRVVVRDVRTGDVATTVDVPGDFTWGGWVAPPVSLSGDHVYVGMDDATLDVRWRTGEVTESTVLPRSTMPVVHDGRSVLGGWGGGPQQVVDVQTGEVLLDLPTSDETALLLSLDGSYAVQRGYAMCDEDGLCTLESPTVPVFDLDSGSRTEIDVDGAYGIGWTPTGDFVRVDVDSVDVCDPGTGTCTETPAEVSPADVRVGGSVYEA